MKCENPRCESYGCAKCDDPTYKLKQELQASLAETEAMRKPMTSRMASVCECGGQIVSKLGGYQCSQCGDVFSSNDSFDFDSVVADTVMVLGGIATVDEVSAVLSLTVSCRDLITTPQLMRNDVEFALHRGEFTTELKVCQVTGAMATGFAQKERHNTFPTVVQLIKFLSVFKK